ncbi:MAG: hypothetical protein ABSD96_09635 [Candidatus Korobacteraceae bacterium]
MGLCRDGVDLSCYLFTYMIFLIPRGRLTDRYGSRNVGAISMVLWSH